MSGKGKTKILVVGAAGGVARVLVDRLLSVCDDLLFTLSDIRQENVKIRNSSACCKTAKLDLFDVKAVESAARDHDLVINCAGPFNKTAAPAAGACLAAGTDYLDLSDEVDAVQSLLSMHDKAIESGTIFLQGAGVSPGLTNVIAADLSGRFDEIHSIDSVWISGDEGGEAPGRAVLEHTLHIFGHGGVRWKRGSFENFGSCSAKEKFDMGGHVGERVLFEVAHPEPVMLARSFPDVNLIRCFGGIDPPVVMSVIRAVAGAVRAGTLSLDDAVLFLQDASAGKLSTPAAWVHTVVTMFQDLFDAVISVEDVAEFAGYMAGMHRTFAGGILCRISGVQAGDHESKATTLALRSVKSGPGTFIDSMAGATGTCAAAFTLLMLDGRFSPGVNFPENTDPELVYSAFARLGFPTDDILECVPHK